MAKQNKQKTMQGIIRTTRGGLGFFSTPEFEEDIRIEYEDLNTALNGDSVEISIIDTSGSQKKGKVIRVTKRVKTAFVGVVEKEGNDYYLVPDDYKMYTDIHLPKLDHSIKKDEKVLVKMNKWTNHHEDPTGKVIKKIGKKGEHETEIISIIYEHNIDTHFPDPVSKEAKNIEERWEKEGKQYIEQSTKNNERKDFRDTPTFTIDPDDAKDFDDALSIKKLPDEEYEVGIHIADVSHYVRPNTQIDEEAVKRGFSVYLVDRTIPMLPEELSNDLCSLKPEVDRLCFSAVLTIDRNAKVKNTWFGKGVIHSQKRFTYKEAQEVLNSGNGKFKDELETLNSLALKLKKERFNSGSIDFGQNEVEIDVDESGVPVRIYRKPRLETHKLIEEFMLSANQAVAKNIWKEHDKSEIEKGFIYRVHDEPDQEKLKELGTFVRALGYDFGKSDKKISAEHINSLFKQIEGKPVESLVKVAMIRAMAKAVYTTKNIGHFGLGFGYYTHFTSPIRRYPDLIVHRMLQQHLEGKESQKDKIKYYKKLSAELSKKEIEVQRAERESIKYKQVEYMKSRIGETFEGFITGVTEWGVYVEEKETGAEGLVRLKDIKGDYYQLDQKKYRVIGQRTKKVYALGDKVKFKVADANVDRKTLDLVLV